MAKSTWSLLCLTLPVERRVICCARKLVLRKAYNISRNVFASKGRSRPVLVRKSMALSMTLLVSTHCSDSVATTAGHSWVIDQGCCGEIEVLIPAPSDQRRLGVSAVFPGAEVISGDKTLFLTRLSMVVPEVEVKKL